MDAQDDAHHSHPRRGLSVTGNTVGVRGHADASRKPLPSEVESDDAASF
jgi:hypothetical protein